MPDRTGLYTAVNINHGSKWPVYTSHIQTLSGRAQESEEGTELLFMFCDCMQSFHDY